MTTRRQQIDSERPASTPADAAGPRVLVDTAPTFTRARVAVTLFFALGGFLFAGWAVRIPAIKDQIDASEGALGVALLGVSGTAVATMLLTGRLCRRFGSRQLTIATAALLSVSVIFPPLTHSPLALGLVLLLFGVAYGGIDVAVNSVAVDLIATLRRPIMPSFHAANSIGSLSGAALGALLAPHLSPARHMLLMAPLGLAATAVGATLLMAEPVPRSTAGEPKDITESLQDVAPARRGRVLVGMFALVALCAAYCQGAMDNWVPLHITTDLAGGPGIAAAAYAAVTLALTTGRLFGTRLLERFGQTRVVLVGGLVASLGALVAALSPSLWIVILGLLTTGLGLANIFPVALARAGAIGGPSGIALASTLGYGGILLAPPSIGFLADAFGLPIAMTVIAPMVALAAVITWAAKDRGDLASPLPAG
ncbi:MAG TPA: MFS transporter [Mycobacteriales bacterium]